MKLQLLIVAILVLISSSLVSAANETDNSTMEWVCYDEFDYEVPCDSADDTWYEDSGQWAKENPLVTVVALITAISGLIAVLVPVIQNMRKGKMPTEEETQEIIDLAKEVDARGKELRERKLPKNPPKRPMV